ncbi:MAG TPA: hypothetical protein VKS60_10720 [Stellaceae bacterium]|nr:hypothetical protein [Stellaceae bacterium]
MTSTTTFGRRLFPAGALEEPLPFARADARTAERFSQLCQRVLLGGAIVSTTLLQKFALPVAGDTPMSVGLILIGLLTGIGVAVGQLRVHGGNLTLYLLMATTLMATQILGGEEFSKSSLALLLAIHLPYIFRFRDPIDDPRAPLRIYQDLMLVIAICGIAQFALQFVIGWEKAFLLDTATPKAFLDPGYHQLNLIGTFGFVYKANGFFMLEASLLSQTAAIAILIELLSFKRWFRIGIYAAAMLVAYSGTGLILLGLLVPVMLLRAGRYGGLLVFGAALLLVRAFADDLHLTMLIDRVGEFSNIRSSGFARFVSIFFLINDFQLNDLGSFMWGLGAGSITHMNDVTYYLVHDPTWGKIVFEYGLLGAVVYFPCFIRMLHPTRRDGYVCAALLIQYLILGGYLLTPLVHALFLSLLVWPWSGQPAASRGSPSDRPREPVRREPRFGPLPPAAAPT